MEPATTPGARTPGSQPLAGTFEEDSAVGFLTSRIDYERTLSVPYSQRDFRLDRMRQLLDRLDNPQRGLNIVHITGTKGKGSVAAMIASVLRAAGLRAGLFSSPHLDRVEERIAVDGQHCAAADLPRLVNCLRPVVAEMDALPTSDPAGSNRPTYFEIITALALLHFARAARRCRRARGGLGRASRLHECLQPACQRDHQYQL